MISERIARSLMLRLGDERFAVWFGDNFKIQVAESITRENLVEVVVLFDPNYPGEWLQKTFGNDVAISAGEIVNKPVVVHWRPLGSVSAQSTVDKPDEETSTLESIAAAGESTAAAGESTAAAGESTAAGSKSLSKSVCSTPRTKFLGQIQEIPQRNFIFDGQQYL